MSKFLFVNRTRVLAAVSLLCAGLSPSRAAVADAADAIVAGDITSVEAASSPVLFRLHVARVLKGTLVADSIIDIEWPGRIMPGEHVVGVKGTWLLQAQAPRKTWRLSSYSFNCRSLRSCAFPTPTAADGESFARRASASLLGSDRFAAELAAASEHLSDKDPGFYRTARTLLVEVSPTPGSVSILRQLMTSSNPAARAIGSTGLVMQGDHEVMKRIDLLLVEAKTYGLELEMLAALRSRRDPDPRNVSDLGKLATSPTTLIGVKRAAVEALQALHSRESLPFLLSLLDAQDAELRTRALSGISMFVDNLGIVTPQSIPSGSWMIPLGPSRWRTPETDKYASYRGPVPASLQPEYVIFWKNWWSINGPEILK